MQTAYLTEVRIYTVQEDKSFCLGGKVFDDEAGRWPDDTYIKTSKVMEIDPSRLLVKTRNTEYYISSLDMTSLTQLIEGQKLKVGD